MTGLRRTSALSTEERSLVVPAAVLLVWFRIVLWGLPFARVRAMVSRMASRRTTPVRSPEAIGRVVEALGRRLPTVDCLPQALAAFVLLSRSGYTATVRIGVAREEKFAAHAWVDCEGAAVVGGAEKARFTEATGADLIEA